MTPSDCVFLATPPGRGGVAAIVVRGPSAIPLVEPLVRTRRGEALNRLPDGHLLYGHIVEDGTVLDEVLLRVERHQGVTTVEIDCHGGPAACEAIIGALGRRAAVRTAWDRPEAAEPGLTRVQQEALQLLPSAGTVRTAGLLLDQYWGALETELGQIRQSLEAGPSAEALRAIETLLATAEVGLRLTTGWQVVVAGRPNVGKSTLVNRLVGYARSIVSATPGTTRDALGEDIALEGWPIRLVDTAGLADSTDSLDLAAVDVAQRAIRQADLIVLLVDRSRPLVDEDRRHLARPWVAPTLCIANKGDLPTAWSEEPIAVDVTLSAKTGTGVDDLCGAIVAQLVPHAPRAGQAVVFTQRQHALLRRAHDGLERNKVVDATPLIAEVTAG